MLTGLVVLLGTKNQVPSPKSSQSHGGDSVGSFKLGLFRKYHRTQRCMSPTSPGEVRIVHPKEKTQTKFERTNINSSHCQGGSNAQRGGACHTEPMAGTKAAKETAKGPANQTENYSLGYELRMEWLPKVGVCRVLRARLEGTSFPGNVELLKNSTLSTVCETGCEGESGRPAGSSLPVCWGTASI